MINTSVIMSDEVKEICRDFYQRAPNNGTDLVGCEGETPLIDCGIQCFKSLVIEEGDRYSSLYEFTYSAMMTLYNWSQGPVRGGWGGFQVNLPDSEIREFQIKLEKVFSNPQLYIKGSKQV